MGHHIDAQGRFQSDRHPELPPDKILVSFHDPEARKALYRLAADYQKKDPELAADIKQRLTSIGVARGDTPPGPSDPPPGHPKPRVA